MATAAPAIVAAREACAETAGEMVARVVPVVPVADCEHDRKQSVEEGSEGGDGEGSVWYCFERTDLGSGGGGLVSCDVSIKARSIKNPDPTVAPMPRTRTSALETTPKRMRTGSWSSTSPTTAPVGSLFGANRTGVAAKRGATALWSTLRRVGILLCARVVSQ